MTIGQFLESRYESPPVSTPRLSYEESCRRLQSFGLLDKGEMPPMRDRMPKFGDTEQMGVEFFRTLVKECDLSGLTLPRTFIARSDLGRVSFANTDLSESSLCWNDFVDVSFAGASLAGCDMRASIFHTVDFSGADLQGADLRRSTFQGCTFAGAIWKGAVLARSQAAQTALSAADSALIDWREEDGPLPEGE